MHYEPIPEVLEYSKLILSHLNSISRNISDIQEPNFSEGIFNLLNIHLAVMKKDYEASIILLSSSRALYPFLYQPFLNKTKEIVDFLTKNLSSMTNIKTDKLDTLTSELDNLYDHLLTKFQCY